MTYDRGKSRQMPSYNRLSAASSEGDDFSPVRENRTDRKDKKNKKGIDPLSRQKELRRM